MFEDDVMKIKQTLEEHSIRLAALERLFETGRQKDGMKGLSIREFILEKKSKNEAQKL
ncbi:MAG: hypothetical protein M1422_01755 [Candidatus Thermoplasmatota archaeon]|jgi:uncharacterized protein YciI|nr:hypothetical protein [Candidatus Thermoplasmatota archaeon]